MTFAKPRQRKAAKNKSPTTELIAGLCFISERATGLEPATSSLGSLTPRYPADSLAFLLTTF